MTCVAGGVGEDVVGTTSDVRSLAVDEGLSTEPVVDVHPAVSRTTETARPVERTCMRRR